MRPHHYLLLALSLAVSGCVSNQGGFVGPSAIEAEIAQARSETPLPPGGSFWEISLDQDGSYQPGSGRDMIQYQAMCEWHRYWIVGLEERDQLKVGQALAWADALRTWAIYTSSRQTQAYIDRIQETAKLGDPSLLQEEVKLNCVRPSAS